MGRRIMYTLLLIAAAAFLFAGCGEMALLQDIRARVEGPDGTAEDGTQDDGTDDGADDGTENDGTGGGDDGTDAVVTIAAVPGITAPEGGETPVTTITETDQYTGTLSWDPPHDPFEYETEYTATITLTAKSGYTLTGVAADFFTVDGATAVTNNADSGVVIAEFPATGPYTVTYHANEGTTGTAPTDSTNYSSGDTVTVLGNTGNLVGALVGGDHTGFDIKQRFVGWNTNSGATTAEYVAGDTFTITVNTTLYAIYTTGTDYLKKVGPAGGWVFYRAPFTQSWGRYLEVAPESTEWTGIDWGPADHDIPGAEGTTTGTGQQNTQDFIDELGTGSAYAAQLCKGLNYGGYNDWFLPSKNELNVIWSNIVDDGDGNNSGVGGFTTYYWSSSEASEATSTRAWYQDMRNGYQGGGYKDDGCRVRAVRAF